ncbi:MAG: hybrid sensor histidine kinase/response regulator, partial [Myxococcaceae bacterium]
MRDDPGAQLWAVFKEEATESLDRLSRLLLDLEHLGPGEPRAGAISEIFRLAHSMKGSAATVGRDDLAEVAHHLESCLDQVRKGQMAPGRGFIDASLAAIDVLGAGLSRTLSSEETTRTATALSVFHPPAASPAAEASAPEGRARRPSPKQAKAARELVAELFAAMVAIAKGETTDFAAPLSLVRRLVENPRIGREPRVLEVVHTLEAMLQKPAGGETGARAIAEAGLLAADFLQSELDVGASPEEAGAVLACLRGVLAGPVAKPPEPDPATAAAAQSASSAQAPEEASVRVPVALLDSLLYRIDELIAAKLRLDHHRRQAEELQDRLETIMPRVGGELGQVCRELGRTIEQLRAGLSQEVHGLGILSQSLQEDVKEVRMVPVGPLLEPFRRMVRELAHGLGKDATLETKGEDVRVDKRLFDLMKDPLTHLLRNAVDHGLEGAAERRESGKGERGLVRISAESRESQVFLEIYDDGRGIDPEQVRRSAVAKGLLEHDKAALLTSREALNLIFLPGLSTLTQATSTSGRGVGLDVVRENVARLGGRIEFFSERGKGTRFILSLPLTLAAARGLFVSCEQKTWCLPLSAVEEAIPLEPGDLGRSHGHFFLRVRSQAIPFAPLADLLEGRASRAPTRRGLAVVLALSDRRLAVGVDEVLGQEEVVVKGLAPGSPRSELVAGATSLADGRLVTVLEPVALVEAMSRSAAAARASSGETAKARTVLVVDDALTTRTMLSSVLQSAGYHTVLATDGLAALSVLQREQVDLVVSDVEMPGLDGFGLTARIRATAALARLPVVLVTSLASTADRARGAEAGANAYVVKRNFD